MNCPEHRRKLELIKPLSNVKGGIFWYYCAVCRCLWKFRIITTKSLFMYKEGITLNKLKRAGFYEDKELESAL